MPQTKTQEQTKTKLSYPDRFCVILYNDDFTPMDFVIQLLIEVFNHNISDATNLTYAVHEQGQAVAGVYFKEIAEQKVSDSSSLARLNGYPLKVTMEVLD
jgi:ATP-dependent Clp protease adaptor protein ClpS